MAGLDPATQSSRGSAMEILLHHEGTKITKLHEGRVRHACADAHALGGRVKPGHDG
jgi:hypothetical protein